MAAFLQDLRYGVRLLFRHRGFTAVAVLVLALGIGANTAVFTLINAMLFKPRPGAPDHELAGVFSRDRTQADEYRAFSYPNYADLRARTDIFASLAAHNYALVGLTEGDATRRIFVDVITANYFDTFGVPVAVGRAFTLDEERPSADLPVTILSHALWQRMGGRDDVVGSEIRLNGRLFTVVGVAARGFGGSMVLVSPELFVPTGMYDTLTNDFIRDGLPATLADRRHHSLILVARLPSGATIESTAPALEHAASQLEQAYPGENQHQTFIAAPLSRLSVSTSPQSDSEIGILAVLLFSMSGLVLLVATFNLANMLFARGSARAKEFAIRLAIGGSRMRLIRQLLAESVVLVVAGGALATLVAWAATRALTMSLAARLPLSVEFDTAPDARILAVTIGIGLVSALLFGLGPALRHARTDAVPELKDQAGEIAGRRRSRFATRNVLVMGQLALSLVTLTAAGLFVRSAVESASADPGFTMDRGIMVHVDPSLAGRNTEATRQFHERALATLRAMPGIESASLSSLMPYSEFTEGRSIQKAGPPLRPGETTSSMSIGGGGPPADERVEGLVDSISSIVGADYFQTMGLAVTRGREFSAAEETGASKDPVAIIDETLAAQLFGRENPIDQIVQWQAGRSRDAVSTARVVGVVAASHHQLLERQMRAHIYTPIGQDLRSAVYLHARTAAPTPEAEAAMLPEIRRALVALDPDLPVLSIETRPMFRERNLVLWVLRAGANVFLAFGVLALFMSVVGVYGVKSYVVARRTREIGIRVAIGATPRDIVREILGDGLLTTALGLGTGLVLSVAAAFLIRGLLVGDGALDVTVVAAAILALGAAATMAAWLPARRAARVRPTLALRSE